MAQGAGERQRDQMPRQTRQNVMSYLSECHVKGGGHREGERERENAMLYRLEYRRLSVMSHLSERHVRRGGRDRERERVRSEWLVSVCTCAHFRGSAAPANALHLEDRLLLIYHFLQLRIVHIVLLPFWHRVELQLLRELHDSKQKMSN